MMIEAGVPVAGFNEAFFTPDHGIEQAVTAGLRERYWKKREVYCQTYKMQTHVE